MGGSFAGEVNYPPHILLTHQDLLHGGYSDTFDGAFLAGLTQTSWYLMADITTARALTPHDAVDAYDPTADIARAQARIDALTNTVDAIDPTLTIADHAANAASLVDNTILKNQRITDAVNAFDQNTKARHLRAASRIAVGYFDIRATMTDQFGMSMALNELARRNEVSAFEANLRLQFEDKRADAILGVIQATGAMLGTQIQSSTIGATLQEQLVKTATTAQQDRIEFDLAREVDSALWDLNLYQYAWQGLGAISSQPLPQGPTKFERGLSGLATGVSAIATVVGLLAN